MVLKRKGRPRPSPLPTGQNIQSQGEDKGQSLKVGPRPRRQEIGLKARPREKPRFIINMLLDLLTRPENQIVLCCRHSWFPYWIIVTIGGHIETLIL